LKLAIKPLSPDNKHKAGVPGIKDQFQALVLEDLPYNHITVLVNHYKSLHFFRTIHSDKSSIPSPYLLHTSSIPVPYLLRGLSKFLLHNGADVQELNCQKQ